MKPNNLIRVLPSCSDDVISSLRPPTGVWGGDLTEHLPSLNRTTRFSFCWRSTKVSLKRLRLYRGWPQELDSLWLSVHLFISHVVAFCSRRPECVVMCSWTDQWCDVCEFCMKIQATICWVLLGGAGQFGEMFLCFLRRVGSRNCLPARFADRNFVLVKS